MSIYNCTGKTYNAKEDLKTLGLRWDGQKKCWAGELADAKLEELKKLAMQHNFSIFKNEIMVFGDEKETPEKP